MLCNIMRNRTGLDPAQSVINKFGGFDAVADALGRHPISVRKWTYDRKQGGTGGLIPTSAQARLLQVAKRRKLNITAADLLGAT